MNDLEVYLDSIPALSKACINAQSRTWSRGYPHIEKGIVIIMETEGNNSRFQVLLLERRQEVRRSSLHSVEQLQMFIEDEIGEKLE
jgi:hypothetical protein